MSAYVDIDDVKTELPTTRPKDPDGNQYSESAWDAILNSLIGKYSQYIDDNVGSHYSFAYATNTQKFPDITDSPSTPSTIEEICNLLVVARALKYYGGTYNSKENNIIARLRKDAKDMLKSIRDGEISISIDGSILKTVPFHSENDRVDGEDDPVFNPDDLDDF